MNQEANTNTGQSAMRPAVHAGVEHATRPQIINRAQPTPPVAGDNTVPQAPPVAQTVQEPVANKELVLSSYVVSRSDLSKSLRELESIDDFFHQAAIRGSKDQTMPTLGKVLDSLAQVNGLNMLKAEDRSVLKSFLTRLKGKAPVISMSFPSEASGPFLAKILTWFRSEVHPHTLMTVGLQPGLVAGCTLRTTNKTFDFSFRKKFEASKEMLIKNIQSSKDNIEVTTDTSAITDQPKTSEELATIATSDENIVQEVKLETNTVQDQGAAS